MRAELTIESSPARLCRRAQHGNTEIAFNRHHASDLPGRCLRAKLVVVLAQILYTLEGSLQKIDQQRLPPHLTFQFGDLPRRIFPPLILALLCG